MRFDGIVRAARNAPSNDGQLPEGESLRLIVVGEDGGCDVAGNESQELEITSRFTRLEASANGTDEVAPYRRLMFSEVFRDFIIDSCVPRLRAERFIRTCKQEDVIWDIHTMPSTWKSLAKIPPAPHADRRKNKKDEGPKKVKSVLENVELIIEEGAEENESESETVYNRFLELTGGPPRILKYRMKDRKKPLARYVDFGLIKRIKTILATVLEVTFPDAVDRPKRPHLLLELWTDGLAPFDSGVENCVWPNCITIIGIGEAGSDHFRYVPARARKPLTIGMLLSGHKPYHSELLLRQVVDELILLDPCPRDDRDEVLAAMIHDLFTARLTRLLADTIARAIAKQIPGTGHTFFCEQCLCQSYTLETTGRIIFVFQVEKMVMREDARFLEYPDHALRVSI